MIAILSLCSLVFAAPTDDAPPPTDDALPSTENRVDQISDPPQSAAAPTEAGASSATADDHSPGDFAGHADDLEPPRRRKVRRRRSRRTLEELDWCDDRSDPRCGRAPMPGHRGVVLPRPSYMRRRVLFGAAALGAGIGFGTGFYYAGDTTQGLLFALADAALWIGLASTFIVFNQLVIRNDFRTGRSLARGERRFGNWEANYYSLGWAVAGLIVVSHAYQGIGSFFAARKTNRVISDFAIVPLGDGGAMRLGLRW